MGFFMGVGKYTPNDAIAGDMGWKPAYTRNLEFPKCRIHSL
jgi:hypothetical protein